MLSKVDKDSKREQSKKKCDIVLCSGTLKKQGRGRNSDRRFQSLSLWQWRERFFELDATGHLLYYTNAKEGKLKGAVRVRPGGRLHRSKRFALAFEVWCFEAVDGESTQLKLCATSEYDLQRWIKAFKESGVTISSDHRPQARLQLLPLVPRPESVESDHEHKSVRSKASILMLSEPASCTAVTSFTGSNIARRRSLEIKPRASSLRIIIGVDEDSRASASSTQEKENSNNNNTHIEKDSEEDSSSCLKSLQASSHWPTVEARLWLDDDSSLWAPVTLLELPMATSEATVQVIGHSDFGSMLITLGELRPLEIPSDATPADTRINLCLEPGSPCRAVYLGDRCWYEAIILESFDDLYAIVLFTEYDETQNTAIQLLAPSDVATPFEDDNTTLNSLEKEVEMSQVDETNNDFDDELMQQSSISLHQTAKNALEKAGPAMLDQQEKSLEFYALLLDSGVPLEAVRITLEDSRRSELDAFLSERRRVEGQDQIEKSRTEAAPINPLSSQLLADLQHSLVFGDIFLHQLFTRQIDRRGRGFISPLDFVVAIKNNDPTNKLAAAAISTFATLDEDQKGLLTFDDFKCGIRKYGRAKNGHEDVKSLLFFWRATSEEWFESVPSSS